MDDSSNYRGQGMEPEAKRYLIKVINSVSIALIWLLINMTAGLFYGYGIPDHPVSAGNILFYAWMLLSLAGLIFYLFKLWRRA